MNKTKTPVQEHNVVPFQIDAMSYHTKGLAAVEQQKYPEALRYFQKAKEHNPDFIENLLMIASVLTELDQYLDSMFTLNRIVDHPLFHHAEVYYFMANNYAFVEQYESAYRALKKYYSLQVITAYHADAGELLHIIEHELGSDFCEQVNATDIIEAMDYERALLYAEERDYAQAIFLFEHIVRHNPHFYMAYNQLALALLLTDQVDQAQHIVEQVLQQDPHNIVALSHLTLICLAYPERCIADIDLLRERLQKLVPANEEEIGALASALGLLGDDAGAYRLFRYLMRTEKAETHLRTYHFGAVAAFNMGLFEIAQRNWKKALLMHPEFELAQFYLHWFDLFLHDASYEKNVLVAGKTKIPYGFVLPYAEVLSMLQQMRQSMALDAAPHSSIVPPLFYVFFDWICQKEDTRKMAVFLDQYALVAHPTTMRRMEQLLRTEEGLAQKTRIYLFALRYIVMNDDMQAEIPKSIAATVSWPSWGEAWDRLLRELFDTLYTRSEPSDVFYDIFSLVYLLGQQGKLPKRFDAEVWKIALHVYVTEPDNFDEVIGELATTHPSIHRTVSLIHKLLQKLRCEGVVFDAERFPVVINLHRWKTKRTSDSRVSSQNKSIES